jgi:hypothetical protein
MHSELSQYGVDIHYHWRRHLCHRCRKSQRNALRLRDKPVATSRGMGNSCWCKAEKGTCRKDTTWHLLQIVYEKKGEEFGWVSYTRDSPCPFRKCITFRKGKQGEPGCQGPFLLYIYVRVIFSLVPQAFLSQAIEAPSLASMDRAWETLVEIGAVDSNGHLTALGKHMVSQKSMSSIWRFHSC